MNNFGVNLTPTGAAIEMTERSCQIRVNWIEHERRERRTWGGIESWILWMQRCLGT